MVRKRLVIVEIIICGVGLFAVNVLAADEFPEELVRFRPGPTNPVFTGAGPGHWDENIRERGWILREGDLYRMWYTGYVGRRSQMKLGYATSPDGLKWTRYAGNPIYDKQWTEDMMIVRHGKTYYMFAEGRGDQAQLLTSPDGLHWTRKGTLDIRLAGGLPLPPGPYGTPTAWFDNGMWYLFYERRDRGIWLASSRDMKVWTNVQDKPVFEPGPKKYDRKYVALNQILRYKKRYYAYYHGSPGEQRPALWSTNVAVSTDLIHWKKFPGNPLQPLRENKSSGILIDDGKQLRLYTMHQQVRVHFPAARHRAGRK